jgi:chorismate-pyruvate lyase
VNASSSPDSPLVELTALVKLFYLNTDELGEFQRVRGADLQNPYRSLLFHHSHMTVTVEEYHQEKVAVEVLRYDFAGGMYHREIRLRGERSERILQYGIVRLNPRLLQPKVWQEIESRRIPLGRVLIEHEVLREVECLEVWRVICNTGLSRVLLCDPQSMTYGRTAIIHCDGQPAIELLEIVAPVLPGQ